MILILAVVGLLPLLMDAKALDATTVSGLVVMELAPPVILLLFTSGYRPLTFHLPFWWCALGVSNAARAIATFANIVSMAKAGVTMLAPMVVAPLVLRVLCTSSYCP